MDPIYVLLAIGATLSLVGVTFIAVVFTAQVAEQMEESRKWKAENRDWLMELHESRNERRKRAGLPPIPYRD